MRLDPRIKDAAYIADCFTADTYHKRIGKPCYFAQHIEEFCNLENCALDTLKSIDTITSFPFRSAGNTLSRFCLAAEFVEERPEEKPEEKKYRPYTLMEFIDKFTVGRPIKYRSKGEAGREHYLMLLGFRLTSDKDQTIPYISIGHFTYTLDELFEEYEWQEHYTEDFKPFGVVEDKE